MSKNGREIGNRTDADDDKMCFDDIKFDLITHGRLQSPFLQPGYGKHWRNEKFEISQ